MQNMKSVADEVSRIEPREFGRRLKALRLELDLTLNQMGEPAGISGETIRSIEDGNREPHDRTIYRLMKAYPKLAEPSEPEEATA